MDQGIDWSVSNRHYNKLVKDGKTDKAAALMSIQTGALWNPARLAEAGIETPEGGHKCPLCGEPNTDEGHLFWQCPRVCQNRDAAIQKTNRYKSE